MLKRRMALLAAAWAVSIGFVAVPAWGTVMTFAFEGVVDEVVDFSQVLTQYVVIGDTLSGTATIDLSVPDSATQSGLLGEYAGAVVAVEGQVGTLSFSLDTPTTSTVQIVNDAPPLSPSYPGPWDRYKQGAYVKTPVVNYELAFGMTLLDLAGTAFDAAMGDSLPAAMPPLDAFQNFVNREHGFILSNGPSITGTLTSITNVPEVGTLGILLLGGGMVGIRRRGSAR